MKALDRKQFFDTNNVQFEDHCTGSSAHEWYKQTKQKLVKQEHHGILQSWRSQ